MWAAHQINGVPGREEIAVDWALAGLRAQQHCNDAAWPYGNPRWPNGRPVAAQLRANRRALPAWRVLPNPRFDPVAAVIESGLPVVLTLRLVRSAWRGRDATIDAAPSRKGPGNHAVLAVGALKDPDRIVIKNSWGSRWGHAGYGYVTRRYLEHYALRAHVLAQ